MPYLERKVAKIYYEIEGEGHPLILIAGYTADHHFYDQLKERLIKNFQVIRLDNRGSGKTEDSAVLSASLMAEDVASLIDFLSLKKPHIVGQSMGGTVAQVIASSYSEKIGKLALIATTAKWRLATLKAMGLLTKMREYKLPFDLLFEATLPWIFGEEFLGNDETIAGLKKAILESSHPQSLKNQKRQMEVLKSFDGRERLKNIKAETLVCYGAQDLLALPAESAFLTASIKGAEAHGFDSAHDVPNEAPDALAKTLIEFFSH